MNKWLTGLRSIFPRIWSDTAGKLALAGLSVWLLTQAVGVLVLPKVWIVFLVLIGRLLLLLAFLFYLVRFFGNLRQRFLWKIRRRLILAYVFVAVIPTVLLVSIVAISALSIYHQLVYILVLNQIGQQTAQVESFTLALQSSLDDLLENPTTDWSSIQSNLDREAKFIQVHYPQAAIYLRTEEAELSGQKTDLYIAGVADLGRMKDYRVPSWLQEKNFSGLVFEPQESDLPVRVRLRQIAKEMNRSNLSIRSIVFSEYRSGKKASMEVVIPFDRYLLRSIKAAVGVDFYLSRSETGEGGGEDERQGLDGQPWGRIIASTSDRYNSESVLERIRIEAMGLFPVLWENGKESDSHLKDTLLAEISLADLYKQLFLTENKYSKLMSDVLQFFLIFFLAVEVVSLLIGVMLTKSITNAVFNLDRGTEILKQGDLNHRIVVKSNDQLGRLAESFNSMVQSLQVLLKERVEKERMDRELEIAKEVQSRLFPKCAPEISNLEICGVCLPARVVSGDFFDYLQFSNQILGITMGDICGKGISAALLMANLQATIRSQITSLDLQKRETLPDLLQKDLLSGLVGRLNRHVLEFTSSTKFATLFCAVFDQNQGSFTYCNAGHNPPLLLHDGEVHRLKTGGTVVGMFSEAVFIQETRFWKPGDIFMGYTDGLVEASNEFDEEFGEERLESLLLENASLPVDQIHAAVLQSLKHWTGPKEQDDDMTLIVARFH